MSRKGRSPRILLLSRRIHVEVGADVRSEVDFIDDEKVAGA